MKEKKETTYKIWGLHVVQEALSKSYSNIEKIFIDRQYRLRAVNDIIKKARELGIPVIQGDFPGKIGVQMGVVSFFSLSDINPAVDKLGIILDGITDEGNIGSIFRTAAAFGVNFVVVPKRRFGSISPVVARISQGGVYKVKIIKSNLVPAVEELKDMGYWIYATHVDLNANPLFNVDIDRMAVFILGSEDKGVSKSLLRLADEKIYIPMMDMQSLNVGVATGIVLYEYRRKWWQP